MRELSEYVNLRLSLFILHVHLFRSRLLDCYVSLCEQLSAGGEEEHLDLSPYIAPLAQSLDSK